MSNQTKKKICEWYMKSLSKIIKCEKRKKYIVNRKLLNQNVDNPVHKLCKNFEKLLLTLSKLFICN